MVENYAALIHHPVLKVDQRRVEQKELLWQVRAQLPINAVAAAVIGYVVVQIILGPGSPILFYYDLSSSPPSSYRSFHTGDVEEQQKARMFRQTR